MYFEDNFSSSWLWNSFLSLIDSYVVSRICSSKNKFCWTCFWLAGRFETASELSFNFKFSSNVLITNGWLAMNVAISASWLLISSPGANSSPS
jgi:hypothetical protein